VTERHQHPCCLTAEPDEVEADPDAFDCETCQLRERLDALRPENRAAWSVYGTLASRLSREWQVGGVAFGRLVAGWEGGDVLELIERLSLIHDYVAPQVAVEGGEHA